MKDYKRITVNMPRVFADILEARMEEAGPYASESAFFISFFIFDIRSRRKHRWTPKVMNLPPKVRDALFQQLADDYKAGKGSETMTWLEHEMERLVEKEITKRTKANESGEDSRNGKE